MKRKILIRRDFDISNNLTEIKKEKKRRITKKYFDEKLTLFKENGLTFENGLNLTTEDRYSYLNLLDYLTCDINTIKGYKKNLGLFLDYISYFGLCRTTLNDYRQYLKDLTYYSSSTKQKYFIPAKHLLKILYTEFNAFPEDITLDLYGRPIKGFRDSRIHRRFGYNKEEVDRIKDYIENLDQQKKETKRIKTAFYLLSHQGLRASEVVNIQVEDISLVNSTIRIQSKGRDSKEEIIITDKVKEILADFLDFCQIKSGYIFFSFSNNSSSTDFKTGIKQKKLTPLGLRLLFKNILISLDIPYTAPLHSFRHNFTTRLVQAEIPITTIQHLTRHRSLASLCNYVDFFNKNLEIKKINEKVFNF